VWNESNAEDEVLVMVVRIGLCTTMGNMLRQVTNPLHNTQLYKDPFLRVSQLLWHQGLRTLGPGMAFGWPSSRNSKDICSVATLVAGICTAAMALHFFTYQLAEVSSQQGKQVAAVPQTYFSKNRCRTQQACCGFKVYSVSVDLLALHIGTFKLYIQQLPCIMHHNPTEPNEHIMVAGSVQLLCTCVVAAHRHLQAVHSTAAMHDAPQPN